MMSMISVFQEAVGVTDVDMVAKILLCGIVMIAFFILKSEEERSVTDIFQYIAGGILYFFTKNWNYRSAQRQVENEVVNPKKEKKKEAPPPLIEDKKKRSKKIKRSSKKISLKENNEPTENKPRIYKEFEVPKLLNMSKEEIYLKLYNLRLTASELRQNYFPYIPENTWEKYKAPNQVEKGCDARICSRCYTKFEIFKGKTYLSDSVCFYHPKNAKYNKISRMLVHPCCGKSSTDAGCVKKNNHVTVQHTERPLVTSPTRRHIKKDLLYGVYALDCEMCYTTGGLEVTRISVVNVDGQSVYDSYVKPKNAILDYNTEHSGVEKHHLENVTINLEDVQVILQNIIHKDTILIGHALNNDLTALGFAHQTVIDTSVIYPNPSNPGNKPSLKILVKDYLGDTIQEGPGGHDCIIDARSALKLVLLRVQLNPSFMSRESDPEEDVEEPVVPGFFEPPQMIEMPLPYLKNQNWPWTELRSNYVHTHYQNYSTYQSIKGPSKGTVFFYKGASG